MELPTVKPSDRVLISERRHCDPPALWFAVILGSIIIHLGAFGILRLLLTTGILGLHSSNAIVPIDVITLSPKGTSPTRLAPSTNSTTTRNPTSVKTRTRNTSNQPQNRQNSSASIPSARRTDPQQGEARVSPKGTKASKPPVSNSSQNQQPGRQTPSTKPNTPTSNGSKPSSATSSSNPTPSTGSSTGQTSPNSQSGGSFIASPGTPALVRNTKDVLHPDDPNYNDKLATVKQGNSQFSSDELTSLGIKVEQALELRVAVVIETTGEATVLPNSTQVLRGNLSPDKAEQVARKLVDRWRFNPTLMAGKPVPRDYYLQITISPNQK